MKNKVKIAFGIVLVPFLLAFAKPNKGFVIYGTITGKTSGEVYIMAWTIPIRPS
jgi:hypothetical protein